MKVWAPAAGSVELVTPGGRTAMTCGPGGWWVSPADLAAGTDYGYSLDGAGPLPDPRSPWQPHGVHGLSRIVDHGSFGWTDSGWRAGLLASAVIYEMHVGTFTPAGTFLAAIERLDHLVDLGVTHLELMPVAEGPGDRGWGYDGVDLYAPHHAYGGPDGLKRLVDACHARGLAVILDVVYNHLGPAGNHLARYGPYFSDRHSTPWGAAVNYDGPGSVEVRAFAIDNALMWLRDYHLDGLRLDAIHAIVDTSAIHLLEEMKLSVEHLARSLGRELVLIAESDLNDPRVVRPREAGGYGLDAQWSDDFHHALHARLTGERSGYYEDFGRVADIAAALERVFVYGGRYSPHRARRHGRPADGVPRHRFLGYLQNHDQVGNRARGERSGALMSAGRLRIGAALVLGAPFVPMLFQGEEWGAATPFQYFTSHEDPDLGRAVSEGRVSEFAAFGWRGDEIPDPQSEATFLASKLDWSELEDPSHRSLYRFHQALVALRPALPPEVAVRYDEAAGWIVLARGPFSFACNLGESPLEVEVAPGTLLAGTGAGLEVVGGRALLPPDSVAVIGPGDGS